ncbi:hypothetical protein NDU88_007568 [Pleurodeles waltl]|uniref:Uncharacterized protein n=1 Tax=Pleurodeles waltl TaxID=8319 RepID=A0AAV7NTN5_PLEWA|nr:hypothetical protein NDU88_007568 [Pleurodeles waltl]
MAIGYGAQRNCYIGSVFYCKEHFSFQKKEPAVKWAGCREEAHCYGKADPLHQLKPVNQVFLGSSAICDIALAVVKAGAIIQRTPWYLHNASLKYKQKYFPEDEVEPIKWVRDPFNDEIPQYFNNKEAEQLIDIQSDTIESTVPVSVTASVSVKQKMNIQ